MNMGIPKMGPVIAIDGPAGTGKSSATRRLSELLGFVHVDTGALYRAIACLLVQQGFFEKEDSGFVPGVSASESAERLRRVAIELARNTHLEFKRNTKLNPSNRIFANGKDLTDFIRTPQMSMAASQISAIPEVRAALLGLQRRLGCQGKAILEGRDIGTVIFPDADVKFFLSATIEERAKRRLAELEASGADTPSFEEIKNQIAERDRQDSQRAVAPLKQAHDAIVIDTSTMTLDEVVKKMESLVREKVVKLKLVKGK